MTVAFMPPYRYADIRFLYRSILNVKTLLVAGIEVSEGASYVKSMHSPQKEYNSQTVSGIGSIVGNMRVRLYAATGTEKVNISADRNLIVRVPFTSTNIFIATGN